MVEYMQAVTTVDTSRKGSDLAWSIVEKRLAACVQIVGPIRSFCWWEGRLEEAQEWQLLMKTTADLFPALEEHIKANHSYETPEIIATPIVAGSQEYLRWISDETRQSGASQ
ncbi:divalent-cation tolerance protein CutA [Microtetraspora sp. NBRC 16547]|uniref:divalent-cation tolerance protein CutA n=1 Tax=Microtetraspora sp. NBRC 16547 TaxID=3030993 RepID=UPI0024A009B5|nr:divalent-cation tolerance protein CutA [Microtetraspora sp. NBRC 16547]GLX01148.1 divalent cation tolerance protein [Microtetraspora sp. NBRC 16547]